MAKQSLLVLSAHLSWLIKMAKSNPEEERFLVGGKSEAQLRGIDLRKLRRERPLTSRPKKMIYPKVSYPQVVEMSVAEDRIDEEEQYVFSETQIRIAIGALNKEKKQWRL